MIETSAKHVGLASASCRKDGSLTVDFSRSRMQTQNLTADAEHSLPPAYTAEGWAWGPGGVIVDAAGLSHLNWIVTSLLEEGSRVQNSARLIAALPKVVRLPLMSLDVADWTFRTYSLGSILFDTL